MPREYRHIKEYEKEILELREQGLTKREIGERFGFSKEQIKCLLKRNRRREEKYRMGSPPRSVADLQRIVS